MYYKKIEEYRFMMPREYNACLAFEQRLKDLGIMYTNEGGNTMVTLLVRTNGTFDVDDQCDILKIIKEDK